MCRRVPLCLTLIITIWIATTFPTVSHATGNSRPVITAKTIKQLTPVQTISQAQMLDLHLNADGSLLTGISEDGESIYDARARLWETATGKLRQNVEMTTSETLIYKFSRDGRYIAVGNVPVNGVSSQHVYVYDMQTGQSRRAAPIDGFPSMLSADGNELVVKGTIDDQSVFAYRFATGAVRTILNLNDSGPSPRGRVSVAISPNLAFVVTVERDQNFDTVFPRHFIETRTGKEWKDVFKIDVYGKRYYGDLGENAIFSPDSHYLLVTSTPTTPYNIILQIYDLKTGTEKVKLSAEGGSFSPDSRYVVIYPPYAPDATPSVPPTLFDLSTGQELPQQPPHLESIAGFSPDSKSLIYFQTNDNYLHIWDVSSGKERTRIAIPYDKVTKQGLAVGARDYIGEQWNVMFSPDSSMLILSTLSSYNFQSVISRTESVNLTWWDLSTGELLANYQDMRSPLAFSADGTMLATLNMEDKIVIWTVKQ